MMIGKVFLAGLALAAATRAPTGSPTLTGYLEDASQVVQGGGLQLVGANCTNLFSNFNCGSKSINDAAVPLLCCCLDKNKCVTDDSHCAANTAYVEQRGIISNQAIAETYTRCAAGRRVLAGDDVADFSFVAVVGGSITEDFKLDSEVLKDVVVAILADAALVAVIEAATGKDLDTAEAFNSVFVGTVVTEQVTDAEADVTFEITVDASGTIAVLSSSVAVPSSSDDDDGWFLRLYIIIMWIIGYFSSGTGGSYGFWG